MFQRRGRAEMASRLRALVRLAWGQPLATAAWLGYAACAGIVLISLTGLDPVPEAVTVAVLLGVFPSVAAVMFLHRADSEDLTPNWALALILLAAISAGTAALAFGPKIGREGDRYFTYSAGREGPVEVSPSRYAAQERNGNRFMASVGGFMYSMAALSAMGSARGRGRLAQTLPPHPPGDASAA